MSNASVDLCELAIREGLPEVVAKYQPDRVGLYAQCFDNYEFKEEIFGDWRAGGDIRGYLRSRVPPTRGLTMAAGMTPACLSILLKIAGPVYTLPYSEGRCSLLEQLADLDFAQGRIDLAVFAYAKCKENHPDSANTEDGYVLFGKKGTGMPDINELLKSALQQVKGEELKHLGPKVDLVYDLCLDSISFVDLFFKLERNLGGIELEFADLKRICRDKHKTNDHKIFFEDVVEYIAVAQTVSAYIQSYSILHGQAAGAACFFDGLFSGQSFIEDLSKFLPPKFPVVYGSVIAPEILNLPNDHKYLFSLSTRFERALDLLFEDLTPLDGVDWVFASKSNDAQFDFTRDFSDQLKSNRFTNEAFHRAISKKMAELNCEIPPERIQILDAACASGHVACGMAERFFRCGRAERALVLAIDLVSIERLWLLTALGAAAKWDEGEQLSGPFARNRKGFFPSDGGAIAILSRDPGPHCASRIVDYYQNSDAETLTAGSRDGLRAQECMAALVAKHQIDAVKVHGTGTAINDETECAGLRRIFKTDNPSVISLKGQIGHALTASSLLEVLVVDEIFRRKRLPPIHLLESTDPQCSLNFMHENTPFGGKRVLLNAFGFGGHNACLVQEGIQA